MGALIFVCPTSGHEVSTGLEIDPDSYRALPKVLAEIKCPACGLIHNLYQVDARLADESSFPITRGNELGDLNPLMALSGPRRHKKASSRVLEIMLMPGKRVQFDDETWEAIER